jgi:antitoxin HicB
MAWYEVKLECSGDTWLVRAPAFPELVSFGRNREDARRHGLDVIEEAIAVRISRNEVIPTPIDARPHVGYFVEVPRLSTPSMKTHH